MRAIDADSLIKWIEYECKYLDLSESDRVYAKRIIRHILVTPTVTATSPRIGKWVPISWGGIGEALGRHECSQCHALAPVRVNGEEHLRDDCPRCGAKMEAVVNDES